jgi:oxygen-independent coproporphyrinogen-3 oxidase
MTALISPDLLRKYDVPGPRYTSYPTADRFVEAFTEADYRQALAQRRAGPAAMALPLSLYVHIPFCESLCYYCACNKIITKHKNRAASYLRTLAREVELHTEVLGTGHAVSQLHLGGGTPTFLSDAELAEQILPVRSVRHPLGTPSVTIAQLWHPSRNEDRALAWLRGIIAEIARTVARAKR